jgi:hypothetical protein
MARNSETFSGLSGRSVYRRPRGIGRHERHAAELLNPLGFSTHDVRTKEMRSNREESNRPAVRIRVAASLVGGCAVVAMAAIALQTNGETTDTTNLRSAGSMQTGVTSTESVAAPSAFATKLATSMASPTLKATPAWGQPSEP